MKSTLAELLLVLRTLSGEPITDELPIVLVVPREAMPCPCEAAYDDHKLYIRNDINWNDARWISVVLHELEHHRQFVARGTAQDCEEWLSREREALLVQTQYLETTAVGWRPALYGSCHLIGIPVASDQFRASRSLHLALAISPGYSGCGAACTALFSSGRDFRSSIAV